MYLSGNLEQQDTWYISSSNFIGNGSNIVGIVTSSYALSSSYAAFAQNIAGTVGSASYSITASYAANSAGTADWNTLLNKPSGIVSSCSRLPLKYMEAETNTIPVPTNVEAIEDVDAFLAYEALIAFVIEPEVTKLAVKA
jgi:hypothetical protein